MLALNVAALISVVFILPETKNVSLERMDKVFGELDFVEAGERESATLKIETQAVEKEMDAEGHEGTVHEVEHTAAGSATREIPGA